MKAAMLFFIVIYPALVLFFLAIVQVGADADRDEAELEAKASSEDELESWYERVSAR